MSRTFLSHQQWETAQEVFPPAIWTPNGDIRFTSYFGGNQFSGWLSSQLEERLKSIPGFLECQPVLLGSWSRGELCPQSDIDILFCGPEEKVREVTERLHQAGLRLRYRMPQDPEDWTKGVESFDILSLWKAKPLSSESASKLLLQQKRLWENKAKLRPQLLKDLLQEKNLRAARFNSISNFLEPNLKYGPGGLRDIEQALQVYELYSEKFQNQIHALAVLAYHKAYLLTLRQKLHLMGCGEVLVSTAQFELAKFFNFKTHRDFMRDLEKGLSRSHFYVNWIFAVARGSQRDLLKTRSLKFNTPEDLIAALRKHPNPLGQQKVRENLDRLLPEAASAKNGRWFAKVLQEMLDPEGGKEFIISVFESRLIDKILPAIRHLVGYVQHDQYHRYTADVHIMQACLICKDIYKRPKKLGPLSKLHKQLSKEDWKVLSWAALYHDLAKGLPAGEHADLGVEILKKDFKKYGFSKGFTEEVAWLVKNHLELSQAAFRKNPKAKKTWGDLEARGVKGVRLKQLAVFTVIDICATNPEAWSEWKGRLLADLVETLSTPSAQNYFSLKQSLQKKSSKAFESLLEEFDEFLLQSLSVPTLAADLKKARDTEKSLDPLVLKKGSELWVRFHNKKDQEGLLANYVQRLYSLGLSVRHAAIQTLPGVGVYDWFQVTANKSPQWIEKVLKSTSLTKKDIPQVIYDQVEWVSVDEDEWILSFKGKDQAGFLSAATKALANAGLNIKSARVHTWGRQVNDIFTLRNPQRDPAALLAEIQKIAKN